MVTAQQACSTEMVKLLGMPYSVVTAQQACSTEMVNIHENKTGVPVQLSVVSAGYKFQCIIFLM